MFDRLSQMEARYDSLSRDMSDPDLVNDQKKYQAIAKEHRDMEHSGQKFTEHNLGAGEFTGKEIMKRFPLLFVRDDTCAQ